MAAVAGDAENINKQARNTRADWVKSPERANWVNDVKNKQAADVLLPLAPVSGWGAPTPPSSAGGPLHPFTYGSCRVPTIAVVGSLVTVWLARATHSHKLTRHSASWAATQSRVTRVKVYGKRYSALRATPGPCRPPAPTVPRAQTTAGTAQTGDRTRDV